MNTPRDQLAFLLTLTSPLGACSDNDKDEADSGIIVVGGSADSADDDGDGDGVLPPPDAAGIDDGDGGGGGGDPPGCGAPPQVETIGDACGAYVDHRDLCNYDSTLSDACLADLKSSCQYYVDINVLSYGADCGAALEDYYVCLSELPCGEFPNGGCTAELQSVTELCQG